jgi:predicted lipoprotein with Yx(FWY)xxD motif
VRHHVRAFSAVAGAVLAAALATACSGSRGSSGVVASPSSGASAASVSSGGTYSPAEAAHSAPATVATKSGPLGKVLVNGKGLTLYLFQADKTSKSTCTGACAKVWPPLLVKGKPTASGGVQSKLLSTTRRSDSTTQVTYHGHPLYRFAGDKKPGDINGQGLNNFGAKWYVLGTNGKQITAEPSQKPSGGGY